MLKSLGAFIIVILFMYLGIRKSYNLNKRLGNVVEFRNMFNDLRFEIYLKNTELPKAIKQIGEKYKNIFFVEWSELMNRASAEESFCRKLEFSADFYKFNKTDIGVLKCIVASLGRLDLSSQLNRLESGIKALDEHIKDIKINLKEKVRLYLGGSVLFGIFIVILLI